MLKAFHGAYCDAHALWRNGKEGVFPAGTYWLAKFVHVCCAPLDTAKPAAGTA